MRLLIRCLLLLTGLAVAPSLLAAPQIATFAGGCFWCVEEAFDKVDGVLSTTSGFANGRVDNPSYEQVSAGGTGHVEAVQLLYDPDKVSYETLLQVFWHNHDPVDGGGQFCDRGDQYRPAIFYHTPEQKQLAEASRKALRKSVPFGEQIVTPIEAYQVFFPAEEHHQDFHNKHRIRYNFYKYNCGRPSRLKELWGK